MLILVLYLMQLPESELTVEVTVLGRDLWTICAISHKNVPYNIYA